MTADLAAVSDARLREMASELRDRLEQTRAILDRFADPAPLRGPWEHEQRSAAGRDHLEALSALRELEAERSRRARAARAPLLVDGEHQDRPGPSGRTIHRYDLGTEDR